MTSENEKTKVRQKRLDVMEYCTLEGRLWLTSNFQTQKLLHDAKELYAAAEPPANATMKQQEDLNTQEAVTTQREQTVAEQGLKLQEREEQAQTQAQTQAQSPCVARV
jgi:hypothetical protein